MSTVRHTTLATSDTALMTRMHADLAARTDQAITKLRNSSEPVDVTHDDCSTCAGNTTIEVPPAPGAPTFAWVTAPCDNPDCTAGQIITRNGQTVAS